MYSQAGKPLPGGLTLASDRMSSYGDYNSNVPMKTFAGQPSYANKADLVAVADMVSSLSAKVGGGGMAQAGPANTGYFFNPQSQSCEMLPASRNGPQMPPYQSMAQCRTDHPVHY